MEYAPPPLWSYAPFLLLLLAIATFPLIPRLAHWWEHNSSKLLVAGVLALATLAYYQWIHPGVKDHHDPGHLLRGFDAVQQVLHHAVLLDYVPFIILLFSLYTISGGILLTGDLQARPRVNGAFLGLGAVLASFIGTTGASMLLIRPLLRTNAERRHKVHTVIFFIFMVSNTGGCLTPLGDPPLFLGFLRGVGFWWTLELFVPWLFINAALLMVYLAWDTFAYRSERGADIRADITQVEPLRLRGGINFLWLLGVVACVAGVGEKGWNPFPHAREAFLLLLALASWVLTPGNRVIRKANHFNFTAILEVACLFIGIFICMQCPVEYLNEEGSRLGISTPRGFFWATGLLSSFLDNAPTYVVFFEAAKALTNTLVAAHGVDGVPLVPLAEGSSIEEGFLVAISLGAVFMGANTYIGNGPNFMVKAIAEQAGVKMPAFFGYMVYSLLILVPLFVVVTYVFL